MFLSKFFFKCEDVCVITAFKITRIFSVDPAGLAVLVANFSLSTRHSFQKSNSNLVLERNPTHAAGDTKWEEEEKKPVTSYFQKMNSVESLLK